MKKILIFIISLTLIMSLSTGCTNSKGKAPEVRQVEEVKKPEKVEVKEVKSEISVAYSVDYEKEIFKDISRTEIHDITAQLIKKVSENSDPENNTNLIIEEIFKVNGITNEDQLSAAKDKINISKVK